MSDQPLASASLDKAPVRIAGMFDAIAGRYDLLNRVLSAGLDRRWRRRAVRSISLSGRETVLDLCTGTADLALASVTGSHQADSVVGLDFAGEMLRLGRDKITQRRLQHRVRLVRADATAVPLPDTSVDAATIAFGIRNVNDPAAALAEVHRVLRPGGRVAILEFGEPRVRPLRVLYLWYFRYVLPRIGRLVSGHQSAYTYLPSSVGAFHGPAAFRQLMTEAGFAETRAVSLTFGVVYLYEGTKPTVRSVTG